MQFYISACTSCNVLILGDVVRVKDQETPFLTSKEIENWGIVCKGQGECFAKKPWATPTKNNRFLFSGIFADKCCLCAHQNGWNALSFRDVGCTLCKAEMELLILFKERIKKSKSCWARLSPCLIDAIVKITVARG